MNKLMPRKALNKAYLKVKPGREQINTFRTNLTNLLKQVSPDESEEFNKNLLSRFLRDTYYHPDYFINTKGRNDLVIHNGKDAKSSVGVIIEAKKPGNKTEMLSTDKINTKALQELLWYFLGERITGKNDEVKHLIATNVTEWFIFEAQLFDKLFAQDKALVKRFEAFRDKQLSSISTDYFYREIAAPAIEANLDRLTYTHFRMGDYAKALQNDGEDNKLIPLFKILSPEHLLKLPFANDSNTLDKRFYSELLHIIGLNETKQGGKKLIERKKQGERDIGSLLENTITQLDSLDKINRLADAGRFGDNYQERLFNVGLELCITWINRILFLKLLEAQVVRYHKNDKRYSFLSIQQVPRFGDLNALFFSVLARKPEDRNEYVKETFAHVPYLNSSLFEVSEIEDKTIVISNLLNERTIPIHPQTVLKNEAGKRLSGAINTLEYLFSFLNAYDFASEGTEEIQEENKTLINASVLGLIFEKINGYKDGSFFTPGFITMYMCRETIRRAVLQKFKEAKGWDCGYLPALYNKIDDAEEANDIINSLKICDPAVGSGHFLVSALNEIIAIKHELKILRDRQGRRLKEYNIEVVNDELVITDEDGELFEYRPGNQESQRVQEALFHEKQAIIEGCLFGVDINPNSVNICRLRLWIELLKHAYYKDDGQLETLPNIDINIKCGNSLVSRFALDADLGQALKKSKWSIEDYQVAVQSYRRARTGEEKHGMRRLIDDIKSSFRSKIHMNDPIKKRLDSLSNELYHRFTGPFLFEPEVVGYGKNSEDPEKKREREQNKLEQEIEKLQEQLNEKKGNDIFRNAFEWRFEFPEVLNNDGDFVGFDVVIGNPPYFSLSKIKEQGDYFINAGYSTYSKGSDIYCLFYELGGRILKHSGLLTYITSNSWLRAIYGNLLKTYFIKTLQPVSLLNIEDIQIFTEATVESNIITLQKSELKHSFPIANLSKDYLFGASLEKYFQENQFQFDVPATTEWFIGNREHGLLKSKIETGSKLLKDYDVRINFGIKTGYNDAFIIDETKKNELVTQAPKNTEIIKPILRGRDLRKYSFVFSGFHIINSHNGVKNLNLPRVNAEKEYPAIYNHLTKYLPKVKERYDQGDDWTNLRNCAYIEDFEKPKIIWGEISDKPKFAYDEDGYYAEATTFLMTGERLKFIVAILNSRLSEWYFNLIGTTTGMGTNRWKKYKIELLPIKEPSTHQEQKIERLADKIINTKKQNPDADSTTIEQEIDQLVYELYGLTEEEIEIIENSIK
jgi:adenine-specific DNA-methyltransferase